MGGCAQLDALKAYPNVLVLTTSNITEAIDLAFVDRADIKAYVGPPGLKAGGPATRACFDVHARRPCAVLGHELHAPVH